MTPVCKNKQNTGGAPQLEGSLFRGGIWGAISPKGIFQSRLGYDR